MSSDNVAVTPFSSSEHLLGRVKWFNNKAGYGFITVTDGTRSGSDVFVHHSAIAVDAQQYKYLVQGEYIEFDLVRVESDKHEWQASNVSGIKGGKLMCETRHESKVSRYEHRSAGVNDSSEQAQNVAPRQRVPRQHASGEQVPRQRAPRQQAPRQQAPRQRGQGPREQAPRDDNKGWSLVGDKRSQKRTKNAETA